MQNQITHFQRFKNYINSLPMGATYTTDDLYCNVGRHESSTWWKTVTKQRMYRTATYQTYLKRLGALQNVKRGTWKVLHHIPEWFYSKHMNALLGYKKSQTPNELMQSGLPMKMAKKVGIVGSERFNPFKSESKREKTAQVTVDVDFLKQLYNNANSEQKAQLEEKYPEIFETAFRFGYEFELTTSQWNGPLMIAAGLAPDGMDKKCLMVNPNYELRTINNKMYTFVYFVKK